MSKLEWGLLDTMIGRNFGREYLMLARMDILNDLEQGFVNTLSRDL